MFRLKLLKESVQLSISLSFSFRSLSTSAPKTPSPAYLISSHGFSPSTAHSLSKLVADRGRSVARFESIISLFKSYGFPPDSLADIFLSYPNMLSAKPLENIKPKLDFLSRAGLSGHTLVHVISNDPFILTRSLDCHIAPCINTLVKFFGNRDDLVSLFLSKRGSWALRNYSQSMESNINTLRDFGVSNLGIAKLITLRVRALSRTPSEFRAIVDKIKLLGLNPSSMMFIYGVCSCAGMKTEKWEAKRNVLFKFGFSEAQFRTLFVKQPGIMNSSMKRLEKMLHYLRSDLGWTVDYIISYPIVLMSSLEKKVMPRVKVFTFLLSEGLVKEASVGRAAMISEAEFQKFFLMPHEGKLPQILDMYKNKKVLTS